MRESARAAASRLVDPGAGPVRVEAVGVSSLCEIAPEALAGGGDLIAGVALRFDGGIWGTALFAMEPEDALAWVRGLGLAPPLEAYVVRGGEVLRAVLTELAQRCNIAVECSAPALEEDSAVGILLTTHAPSDTAVLWARLAAERGPRAVPVHLYALVDPKLLAARVSAASAA